MPDAHSSSHIDTLAVDYFGQDSGWYRSLKELAADWGVEGMDT
jgi:hypothetical protein